MSAARRPIPIHSLWRTGARAAIAGACAIVASGCAARASAPWTWPSSGQLATNPWAARALGFANAQVGKPYCWGGTGPRCFDCSGLVQAAWGSAGVRLPRTSEAQADALPTVEVNEARPGDILWWPGHVGLYAGDGIMVDAINLKNGIRRHATRRRPEKVLRVVR